MHFKEMIFCTSILAAAAFMSCADFRTNTPSAGQPAAITAQEKLAQPPWVLPIKEMIEGGDATGNDGILVLRGQVIYTISQVTNHKRPFVELELLVELELGEELGWKIGGTSIDHLELEGQSKCMLQKRYLIDESDPTRMLYLLFDVSPMQLTIRRIWISRSKNSLDKFNNQ